VCRKAFQNASEAINNEDFILGKERIYIVGDANNSRSADANQASDF